MSSCKKYPGNPELTFQGFESIGSPERDIICAQFPQAGCSQCMKMYEKEEDGTVQAENEIYYGITGDDNCQMNCDIVGKNNIHTQIGQVILWREIPRKKNERVHFWVSLTGVSGPATYGLSAIFVDDDQKKRLFNMEKEVNLLSELQATVREKFMELFCRKLDETLEKIDMNFGSSNMEEGMNEQEKAKNQRSCYFKRVKQAAAAYLSTVLYRYFLPFLSLEDEYRICNEMRTYVTFMMAAGVSPFSLDYPPNGDPEFSSCASEQSVKEAAKIVPEVLEAVLRGFRGVEAFYGIDVEVKLSSESPENAASAAAPDMSGTLKLRDSRKVLGIKALKDQDAEGKEVPCVNCLFKFNENPAN